MKRESFKKVIALALSAVMAWGLVACGMPMGGSSSKESGSSSSESFSSLDESSSSKGGASSSLFESSFDFSSSEDSSSDSSSFDSSEDSSENSSSDSSENSSENSSSDSSSDSSEKPSSPGGEVTPQGAVPYDGSEVTITFYHTMGANLRSVLDRYIPKFNELYPNITVEHDMMGDYPALRDQIATELIGGRAPSLAYCYPDHVALYKKAKVVLPLDDYIASTDLITLGNGNTETMGFSQAQLDDFIPAFYEEGRVYGDDKMYTLPFLRSTEVLYYNKTFFEKYDLTVPTTWDEMEVVCKKIKAIDNNCVPLGYDSEANWFITMTQQLNTPYITATGDYPFLFNTPENRAFVERFTGWYQKGYVTTEEIYGGYTSSLFTETNPNGMKCYMCIASSTGASYQRPDLGSDDKYPFEVGVEMIPQAKPEAPAVIQQGPSVCLFKKSNPQEQAAAWLFAKFLTTNVELQAQFSMTSGFTPVIKSATEHPVYQDFLSKADGNEYLQAACIKQALAQQNAYFILPGFEEASGARNEVLDLMVNCFTKAPKEGAAAFIERQFKNTVDNLLYDYGY